MLTRTRPADQVGSSGGSPARTPPGPLAVLVAGAVVCWMTVDVLRGGWWAGVDQGISDRVRELGVRDTFWLKAFVYGFTQFGARGTILVLFVPFVVIVARRRHTWQPVLRFVVALGMLTVVVYAMKYGIGRTAPPVDEVHAGAQSYPSGHAPNAVLMWGLMAWLAAEHELPHRLRRLLGVMRYAAPLLSGAAMLLLDYHWLTDLVAGIALGVLMLRVLHAVFAGRLGQWGNAVSTLGEGGAAAVGAGSDPDLASPGTSGVVR